MKYIKDPDLKIVLDDYVTARNMNINKNTFFESNKLWSICDKGTDDATVTAVTKRVNGGVIGLSARIEEFKHFYNLLK